MKNLNSVVLPSVTARALTSLLVLVLAGPALAASTATLTSARLADYTPFPQAAQQPLRPCRAPQIRNLDQSGDDMIAQATIDCRSAAITWAFKAYQVIVTVNAAGRTASLSFNDGGLYAGFRPPRAFQADLNGDGRPDYLIEHETGGSDMQDETGSMVLALSSRSGYRLVRADTGLLTPQALIRRGQGTTVLCADLMYATGPRRQNHAYYVFRPYDIRGQALVSRPAVWIQFTKKPNHTATQNLSAAQKAAALRF